MIYNGIDWNRVERRAREWAEMKIFISSLGDDAYCAFAKDGTILGKFTLHISRTPCTPFNRVLNAVRSAWRRWRTS